MTCLRCSTSADVDIEGTHEPDRRCWTCKAPWVPAGYDGRLVLEDVTVTPSLARGWMAAVADDAGHWSQGRPSRVREYADLMRAGAWRDKRVADSDGSVHPISFDCHGRMLTGVLRLMACIEANVAFGAVLERFDPVVPGGAPFRRGFVLRKQPRLLTYWKNLAS